MILENLIRINFMVGWNILSENLELFWGQDMFSDSSDLQSPEFGRFNQYFHFHGFCHGFVFISFHEILYPGELLQSTE